MPSYWDENGNMIDQRVGIVGGVEATLSPDTTVNVGNIPLRQQVYENGYRILEEGPNKSSANGKITIDGSTEQSIQVSGMALYLQNVGDAKVYMDSKPGVNADKWEIVPGRIAGPFSATDKLYFKGAAATVLKYIFVSG